jgi:hypothetical protein
MNEQSFTEACAAWERYCRRHGFAYQQPSRESSEVSGKSVYLRNIRGNLARYDTTARRIYLLRTA